MYFYDCLPLFLFKQKLSIVLEINQVIVTVGIKILVTQRKSIFLGGGGIIMCLSNQDREFYSAKGLACLCVVIM